MLIKGLYNFQAIEMSMQKGDILSQFEEFVTEATVGAVTLTGPEVATTLLDRTGAQAGAFADNLPTASAIIQALMGDLGLDGGPSSTQPFQGTGMLAVQYASPGMQTLAIDPKASYRWLVRNSTTGGFADTLTRQANSGVSVTGSMVVATASWVEFNVRIDNATPQVAANVGTTNASPTLTGLTQDQANAITPGQTISGTNITDGTTVLSVNRSALTVTMSANATGTGSNIAALFMPSVNIARIRAGSL